MKKWFPSPMHSLIIFVAWAWLNESLSAGTLLIAAILATLIPLITGRLQEDRPRVKRPIKMVKYLALLLVDILKSNIAVVPMFLGRRSKLNSQFVAIPLSLKHPIPISILASSITLTPATVSVEVSEDLSILYVHVLNLQDAQSLIDNINNRYQRLLSEAFEC
ncbi:Na+/H+ antiporter subunit E [Salinibius halmophilus]|uniref:Na+/H+ antiporter subunit E n=1 Tax=Salinibius halmophilus TaxID=1853216 RepID=UPI000E673AD4|nr:Na+/H+ antiporter subunit E [Salinibius halmophilus]